MSTKLDSLMQHINDGHARTQQTLILFVLTTATGWGFYPTRLQIEEMTKIRTSSVCARLNELMSLGKVTEQGVVVCPATNKKVHIYAAVRPALATTIYHPVGVQNGTHQQVAPTGA